MKLRIAMVMAWCVAGIALVLMIGASVSAQRPTPAEIIERAEANLVQATAERKAAERTAAEKAAAATTAAEKAAAAEAAARQAASDKAAAERQAKQKPGDEASAKTLAEKEAAAKKAADAAAAAKAEAGRAATAKTAADTELNRKAAAERAAQETVTAEKTFRLLEEARAAATRTAAAERTLEQKATAAKRAAEQLAAAGKSPADKLAAAKQAAEKAESERAAAEKGVAESKAAQLAAVDKAAEAHARVLGGLKPISGERWTYAMARHLLVRAGFGGTPAEVQELYELGLHGAVDHLVNIYDRPVANLEFDPMRLERPEPWESRLSPYERNDMTDRRRSRERRQQAELRRWWLERMATSPRPLQEKLTLFWHDHFAVQYQDVARTQTLYQQNQLFRRYGCDNFAALLHGIIQDPGMIRYLDNHQNYKGRGNENLGRELQELFSMGEENSANHRPDGYKEEDVREVSRALTGYSYDSATEQFRFYGTRHDETSKTVLGRRGNFSGDEAVDVILQHPATARYISKKLFTFFAYEDPEPEVVETLAHVLRTCSYDLRPMLKNLFLSEQFYSQRAMGSHIKGPVELVVGVIRDLGLENVNYASVDAAVNQMGQLLFEPPNVAGWDEGRSWINAERILVRYNQVASLVERPEVDLVAVLEQQGLETAEQVVEYLSRACLVLAPSQAKRRELTDFLGQLPSREQWAKERSQLNAKLRALVVLLLSTPESQVG